MGLVVALERMAVVNDTQLFDFLADQPAEVSGGLAYRAALRALADVTRFDALDEATSRYALAACRATLTAGVLVHTGDETLRGAAAQAAKGTTPVRQTHKKLVQEDAPAADAMVRVISAVEAAYTNDSAAAADLAGHAMARDAGCYADCDLPLADMPSTPIILPPAPQGMRDQFAASDAWAFWRAWHEEALRGRPLPWELQAEIARLPQDIWDAGPSVIATHIARIFARVELTRRIKELQLILDAQAGPDESGDEEANASATAGFAAARLIAGPLEEILAQATSPQPQPFLIKKGCAKLETVLAASGKWLGRAVEGDIKDTVRLIGKSGGVATATWIDQHAAQMRAVVKAAHEWRNRLPQG